MDAFSYLSVLISIVLGLGITQLLSGFARGLENRKRVKPYGPAILWAAFLLIVHVQTWWTMFPLRQHPDWNFLQFSIVLLQPSILYLLSALILPSQTSPEQDLKANYFANRSWFFGLLLALLAVSVAKDLVREGGLPDAANLAFHGVFAAGAVGLLITQKDRHHRLGAAVALALILIYVGLLWVELV